MKLEATNEKYSLLNIQPTIYELKWSTIANLNQVNTSLYIQTPKYYPVSEIAMKTRASLKP